MVLTLYFGSGFVIDGDTFFYVYQDNEPIVARKLKHREIVQVDVPEGPTKVVATTISGSEFFERHVYLDSDRTVIMYDTEHIDVLSH